MRDADAAGRAPGIAASVMDGGSRDVTLRVFPNLNHFFLRDSIGFPGAYHRLDPTVEPDVIEIVVEWLKDRFR